MLAEGVLPLYDAAGALGEIPSSGQRHAVVVRGGERRMALAVGRLVGQRELVTRPLPPRLAGRAAVSGGAVLASGDIALIVDCDALASGEPSVAAHAA
jgi:two-component system chemotaxis sensor kinase CheA